MKQVHVLLFFGCCCTALLLCSTATAQAPFTDISAGLAGVYSSGIAAAWADYDNDGDLDVLVTGSPNITKLYRDNAGTFNEVNAGLPQLFWSTAAWGDYDNDGDLDLLLSGDRGTGPAGYITKVYRNTNGTFTDINAGLQGTRMAAVAWGDYDNDGDLDILLVGHIAGHAQAVYIAKVYRNDAGTFTDINANLAGTRGGSVDWGDYDSDGDLDILITGARGWDSDPITKLYNNNSGTFTEVSTTLPNVAYSCGRWGDYDKDGDLDLLLCGGPGSGYVSRIYNNNGGVFTDINAGLVGVATTSVAWGDYDNDGDLDALLTGTTGLTDITRVYRNDAAGIFTDINAGLLAVSSSTVAWGDYDNDGDLDILLVGWNSGAGYTAKVYRNNVIAAGTFVPNVVPFAPSGLASSVSGADATFTWEAASDTETPASGLTYNLRVGTSTGGMQVISPMALGATGYRTLPALGKVNINRSCTLKNLTPGIYYWSVQAIDNELAGGPFAAEQSFAVAGPLHHFVFAPIASPQYAGKSFDITIAAKDINDVTVSDFSGTADLSTTAGAITPPVSSAFVNGQWTGSVTVSEGGLNRTITAILTGGTERGTSNSFTVIIPVVVDIRPGCYPNVINIQSKGVMPLAIMTTPTFDATIVDPLSVRFGPSYAMESHGKGHVEDADGDGDKDMVLHFKTQETGIQCGQVMTGLTGNTLSGVPIAGQDPIVVIGCGLSKPVGGKGTADVPTDFLLHSRPNPFNPSTTISYALPVDADVSLVVYDVLGREVAQLADGEVKAGYHNVIVDGSNWASGLYFCRLTATAVDGTSFNRALKMALLK